MTGWLIALASVALIAWVWRGVNNEINQPYTRRWTSRVRVPATWHDAYLHVPANGVADFQLGEGPCGLIVTEIYCGWAEQGKNYYVSQKCSNGERKTFTYRREDITGRIEETTESEEVNPKEKKK